MNTIANKEQFEQMLADKQAVLFISVDWSKEAVASLPLFESWVKEWRALRSAAPVRFYRLDVDAHADTWPWVGDQARSETDNENGSGSVTWLRRGRSIAFVRFAAQVGKDELSRLTDEHFGAINAA